MLNSSEKSTLKSVIRRLMLERTNPVLITEIATRIHETDEAERIWMEHHTEYTGSRISLMISDLPNICLVGTTESGTGACYALDTTIPITLHGSWQPWGSVRQANAGQQATVPLRSSPLPRPDNLRTAVLPLNSGLSSDERDRLIVYIRGLIEENGGRLLSSVVGQSCLTNTEIFPLRNRFSSFSSMLSELAPEIIPIRNEETGQDFLIVGSDNPSGSLRHADQFQGFISSDGYPKSIDVDSREVQDAVAEMHAFAFMGWWNVTSKSLKRLTGYTGNNQQIWCGIIALEWKKAREENRLIYHRTSVRQPDEAICVFNTGLANIVGQEIFFILTENYVPNRQPWTLTEITFIGDNKSVFSSVLSKELNLERKEPVIKSARRIRLIGPIRRLIDLYESVTEALQQTGQGVILDKDRLLDVQKYLNGLLEIRSSGLLNSLNIAPDAEVTLSDLLGVIGENPVTGCLEDIDEILKKVLEKIAEVLRYTLGINVFDESFPTGECKKFLDVASVKIYDEYLSEEYYNQYSRWIGELSKLVRFLWQGNKTDCETISGEFMQNPATMNFISDTLSKETQTGEEMAGYLAQAREMLTAAINERDSWNANQQSFIQEEAIQSGSPSGDVGAQEDPEQDYASVAEVSDPLSFPETEESIEGFDLDDLIDDIVSSPATDKPSVSAEETIPPDYSAVHSENDKSQISEESTHEESYPDPALTLDQDRIEQCLSGEKDPEMTVMEFGNWNLRPDWKLDYSGLQNQTELQLLTDPSKRNWTDISSFICKALEVGNTEAAGDLMHNAPHGTQRELFCFLQCMQQMMNQPDNAENLLYKATTHLNAIFSVGDFSFTTCEPAALSIMTAIPAFSSRCLQIDAMRSFFNIIMPDGTASWISYDEGKKAVDRLRLLLFSENADEDYLAHVNVSARLRSVVHRENRNQTLRMLQEKGRNLIVLFEESNAKYKNERTVLHSLASPDKSLRTYYMLQSLIRGQNVGNPPPFENESEILDFINNLQATLFDARVVSITGAARSHLLARINELNAAYCDLLGVLSEDSGISSHQLLWFTGLKKALYDIEQYTRSLLKGMDNNPLYKFLLSRCDADIWISGLDESEPEHTLSFDYGSGETWPLLDEDRRIISLVQLGGLEKQFATLEKTLAAGNGTVKPEEMIRLAGNLIVRCRESARRLSDLKWANIIDDQEYKELRESLSSNIGWLQRDCSLLEGSEAQANQIFPLLRNEMEIWYCEQRISCCVNHMAAMIRKTVTEKVSDAGAVEINKEIEESVRNYDVRGLMDRFSDSVTEITTLQEEIRSGDLFFRKNIYNAIYVMSRDEIWGDGILRGIDTVSSEINRVFKTPPAYVSAEEVKMIGSALSHFATFGQSSYDELLKSTYCDQIMSSMTGLFRFLGFRETKLEILSDHMWLTFGAQDRTVCPLPDLGRGIMINSTEGRRLRVRYRVQTVADFNHISSLLSAIQPERTTEYTILLCPFALSFEERQSLLMQSRQTESNHTFFLLDKCFIRFSMFLSERERIKSFYACCTHLMRLFPYDVNTVSSAGAGVFFGRANEIERIMNASGASVIYGGRRLGKTSIMRELEWRWLNQSENNLVVYLDLKNESNFRPDITLWYLIARNLSKQIKGLVRYQSIPRAPGRQEVLNDAQAIIQIIKEYLQTIGGKLLLLLDESDNLIYRDTVRYRERWEEGSRINELIKLLNITENRVKIVMAGLDRVTRFVRNLNAYAMQIDPNWEVFQRFNNNIPLRPMLGSDMKNAFDLVDLPFKIMGYKLDRASIVYILRVSCFRPNLIQNYCFHLLGSIYADHEISFEKDSLYLHIPHERVTAIFESRNGNTEFHQSQRDQSIRIPLNVGVTLVYAPVAYTVALMSFRDSAAGMFSGFTPQAILSEVLSHNRQFADNTASALEYITTILNDLSTMGVLRSIHINGTIRYALFSNYMLQMLGDEDRVLSDLETNLKNYVEKNNKTSEELREMYADRFATDTSFQPLTIGQMDSFRNILENDGCAVVVGSEMLLVKAIPQVLQQMNLMGMLHRVVEMTGSEFDSLDIDCVFTPDQDGNTPLIIIREGWTAEEVLTVKHLHQSNADIMVIMIDDADACFAHPDRLADVPEQNVVHLTRLERSFRNSWFEHILDMKTKQYGEDASIRMKWVDQIGEKVGNWPLLAIRLHSMLLDSSTRDINDILLEFEQKVHEQAALCWKQIGMDHVPSELWDVITSFDQVKECIEYAEISGIKREDVLSALTYLNHMNVVDISIHQGEVSENSIYRIDPYTVELGKAVYGR